MAYRDITVTGETGGTAGTLNTAGVVGGGVGNIYHNTGSGKISVTGQAGGTAGVVNTAARVEGIGNITHDNSKIGETNYNVSGSNVGQIGSGGTSHHNTFGASPSGAQKKGSESLTSAQLLEKIKEAEVTEETLKKFEDKKITGKLFLRGNLGDLLKKLGISDEFDVDKLEALREDLEQN